VKFARTGDIIDKKFVQMDTELEKVIGLVGEKIEKEMGKLATNFSEVMEVEEEWSSSPYANSYAPRRQSHDLIVF
jgi:hypothetical protein